MEKLIKNYRVECKSYSSRSEFAPSSVSLIRFHIKFMADETRTRAQSAVTVIHISPNIRTTGVCCFNAVYSSRHRDCFAVLISKMVNALETAMKNEERSLVAF